MSNEPADRVPTGAPDDWAKDEAGRIVAQWRTWWGHLFDQWPPDVPMPQTPGVASRLVFADDIAAAVLAAYARGLAARSRAEAADAAGVMEDAIARLRWFAETGDLKAWSGPDSTVDSTREAMREDMAAVLELLDARPTAADPATERVVEAARAWRKVQRPNSLRVVGIDYSGDLVRAVDDLPADVSALDGAPK